MKVELQGYASLHHGNCLDLMPSLPEHSANMILCDLPYGTTACKWDSVIPFEPLWAAYRRIAAPGAAIVLTAAQPFTSALVMSNPREFRHEWIWRKNQGTNPMNANRQPMKNHESVLVFCGGVLRYNPQMWKSTPYGGFTAKNGATTGEVYGAALSVRRANPEGTRYPLTVQDFKMEKGLHPTQKPVALMEYLIRTYTNEGDTVLDNCMGSGTTGVACANTGRRFIGMEMDAGYFAVAEHRVTAAVVFGD